ncbi:ankyrin repeat domain-containing protein 40-like isoform X2 [Anas acuta]|uniref:ankyrin repeat domain-containing protein 40-like isoform X2 n=1 Tax=Anas acuta TaxID=28680 RepID=UPI0035C8B6A3
MAALSSASEERELQERLREAAALGDAEEVRRLLGLGVDPNSQNEVDGWTCLHWACKRNHAQVVACLLAAGADKQILTATGELAAQLTSKPDIRKILGATQVEGMCTPTSCNSDDGFPVPDAAEQLSSPSAPTPAPTCKTPEVPNGPVCQPPLSHSEGLFSPVASNEAVPQQTDSSPTGPAPTFQPFFFTGTFPYNMQELVLKVRVQNLRDNDFIEIELDRQELTYQDLLRVSCCELGINPEQVEKIRKLPNTLVRKDKDVARLQDFQELELVLVKSDSSPFRNAASTLTERPCYNSRASKLTY